MLGRFGPTWRAAPSRRLIQASCLFLFLALLFYVAWPYGSPDYARSMQARERIPAELFLWLDPLLAISTAIAGKTWIPALTWTLGLLVFCLFLPRAFCGYMCPLGTIIDCFDWCAGRISKRPQSQRRGWWVHLKYYLLAGTLIAAVFGTLLSGFVAAIPVVTRGLQFSLGPLQLGLLKGWYLVPPLGLAHWLSLALFVAVLGLGLLQPRFWCRYVCPTGAVFSFANFFRRRERKVTNACVDCGKCIQICPFDAILPDFTTRTADCTVCGTCAGVCPTDAIIYTSRRRAEDLKPSQPISQLGPRQLSRRGFLSGAVAGLAAGAGTRVIGSPKPAAWPVRPPGSVPEDQFLQLCIRCAACFQACPNSVLQPLGFQHGLDALWTPHVVARWSGCDPTCNNCGQVCPTGAIRPLPIEEKRAAHMALAIINEHTCLPYAHRAACQLCADECNAAGYNAIEFQRVGTQVDAAGAPIEGSGYLAPVILPDKCVGCGLCESRCYKANAQQQKLLSDTAVHLIAGPGKDDRITSGSYRKLHEVRTTPASFEAGGPNDSYLPDFLK